jgi:hypothetical protein
LNSHHVLEVEHETSGQTRGQAFSGPCSRAHPDLMEEEVGVSQNARRFVPAAMEMCQRPLDFERNRLESTSATAIVSYAGSLTAERAWNAIADGVTPAAPACAPRGHRDLR